jgi:MAX-like protein X
MKLKSSRGLSSEQKEVYKEIRRQSHISAEQKRRGTIKQGFDQLQSLVIDPSSYPSGKVSKAAVLEKTVEFIEHAHREREQRERQMQALRKEQEELNAAITKCQENLPASGVPVTRQRFEENRRRFQEYVQQRTLQNYKFWIYSIILQQLFDSYNSTVSTGNQDELCRTVLAWFEQNCSLHALRPVVMNSLKELSTKTSILSEPSQVPQQLVQYAKEQLKASQDFNS